MIRLGTGEVIATADRQIGRILLAPNGDLYYTTATTAYRVAAGTHAQVPVTDGLAAPHGLALAGDGALLISNTESDSIVRVDPATGTVTTFARLDGAAGDLAVGPDGSLYVCDMTAQRVVHLTATGRRIGFVGPGFAVPYALAVAADGGVYVVEAETAAHQARGARRRRHDSFDSLTTGSTLTETSVSAASGGGLRGCATRA